MKVNFKIAFKYIVLLAIISSYGFNTILKHNNVLFSIETSCDSSTSESNSCGDNDYLNDDQLHNPDSFNAIVYTVEILPYNTKNEVNSPIVSPIWQPPKM